MTPVSLRRPATPRFAPRARCMGRGETGSRCPLTASLDGPRTSRDVAGDRARATQRGSLVGGGGLRRGRGGGAVARRRDLVGQPAVAPKVVIRLGRGLLG